MTKMPTAFSEQTLARIEASIPNAPPGATAKSIHARFGQGAIGSIWQALNVLRQRNRVTCDGEMGKRRYWRVSDA